MKNGFFSFNLKDNYKTDLKDDFGIFCLEYNKMINTYQIKQELYSKPIWDYIIDKFSPDSKKDIVTFTEVSLDEKLNRHELYKYYVKCYHNSDYFYIVFYDELRGWDDDDYQEHITEDDKQDKITSLSLYYDPLTMPRELLNDVVDNMLKYTYIESDENQFFTIIATQHGYGLKAGYIKKMDIDLELNYGKKFLPIHNEILDKLQNTKKGLFLLSGKSGTGKTCYIRHLIQLLSNEKTLIYVPSYMMFNIASPEFISFISSIKNSILILEDAESILSNSVENRTQAVSNILNMTDGLLNDTMGIQIIATFNTSAKMIDSALTRAGRLQVNYRFNELSAEEANILCKSINNDKTYNKSVSLAEIYEGTSQLIVDDLEKKSIGFAK